MDRLFGDFERMLKAVGAAVHLHFLHPLDARVVKEALVDGFQSFLLLVGYLHGPFDFKGL